MRGYLLFLLLASVNSLHADEIDFTRDVRPLLSGRCFKCHGPDPKTREAGLRLDQHDAAILELESRSRAIVPGQPDASELLARVSSQNDDERMPPPEEGPVLTDREIAILRKWIEKGAKYDRHWSFEPPHHQPLPEVSDPDWPRNGIDYFVLNRLDAEGLKPSPVADRRTLIRRASLAITGLPPSLEAVANFVADESPDAYETLIDRLLASPGYGERWGRIWLDLARYADSAGYADDPPREIWMFRDWVINSLNAGMPIDQFTIEQLAGDLLPNPTDEQLIATAFHRNTMTNSEGGTDDEEFRNAAIVDRVNTTMQVWMGLTVGCAQCHTHKYDPITQEEYYNVFAILNQTEDADRRDESPLLKTWTPELTAKRDELQRRLEEVQQELTGLRSNHSDTKSTANQTGPVRGRFVRIDLPGKKEFLSLAEVQVFAGEEQISLKKPASQSSTAYEAPASLAVDGITSGHFFDVKSTTHTEQDSSPWWEVDLGEEFQIDRIVVWNRNDNESVGQRLNQFRVVLLSSERDAVWVKQNLQPGIHETVIKVPQTFEMVAADERLAMTEYQDAMSPQSQELKKKITDLEKQLANLQPVTTPIVRELPEDKHRKTHIQIRGNFLDLGPEVQPGMLQEFGAPVVQNPNRLDLAHWLISPDNPLTARVFANRYWEDLFGRGLVETSEDFGLQGELPTHPRLLDWLAINLRENGWQHKEFIKLIVTSATFMQQSTVDADLLQKDPANQFLTRGPRFRLPAEMIRDQALAIAGLLSSKMNGPSVNPPRPKLGLSAAFGGSTDWDTSPGEDQYRRGLYTTWRRSMPYPSMDAFDAPSREVCTIRRIRTNTPLQALVTLNDPVYVNAARGLAGRILLECQGASVERLMYGFELCTARSPNSEELEVLQTSLNAIQSRFQDNPVDAESLLAVPEISLERFSRVEQATWTVLSNVLLNLDETLTLR